MVKLRGRGEVIDFGTFPPDIFRGLFLCHRGYCQVCETSEIAFVAICVRSSYKMPGLKLHVACHSHHFGGGILISRAYRRRPCGYLKDLRTPSVVSCDSGHGVRNAIY